ncbi:YoaK family protein [Vibrio nigripulchritudo]|uniref:YoaK family protein n=1 Tax=Vibrio nigripulchritudo TaxID=28173 RepID=UPI00249161D9|nr:YoaK family protein [Vibrio nigripulchritudo]
MLTRLPPWVEYGAFCLAAIAGIVNAIGLLGFQHQSVSHLSGTLTLLGTELLSSPASSLHLLWVVLSFLAGAAVSGLLIQNTALKLGRHYGIALVLEGILLSLAAWVLTKGSISGHYLASAACGLQNAMVTTYSGAVVRTTHMTGIITDLGLLLGARLRGEKPDRRKLGLFMALLFGFVIGGILGAYLFSIWAFNALLFPAFFAFSVAGAYSLKLALSTKNEKT